MNTEGFFQSFVKLAEAVKKKGSVSRMSEGEVYKCIDDFSNCCYY